ncbi:MAG: FtsX-like permease family protein [Balneolaceae bacterium]
MKMLLTISWRNIWRNPGRSGVLFAAIVAGLWAGVLVVAWANGLVEQRMNYLIQTELSHAQIHHPEFRTERESSMYIADASPILSTLEEDSRVQAFAPRTITDGMLQSPVTTSGISIRGIDVEKEPRVTTLHENITEGDYLDTDVRNPVLISNRIADTHNVEIGHRIVLNFQDAENELTAASFTIVGLYQTSSSGYDERNVFVRTQDLSPLLSDQQIYHEIAVWLNDEEDVEAVVNGLNERLDQIEVQTWYELSPELRYLSDAGGLMMTVIMVIIMMALAFGILNTMLMAIFERMRELGMLLAIGMSKARVFLMIMLESIILTLTGAAAGLILASLTIAYLSRQGIDLTMFGDGLSELGYDSIVYPIMNLSHYGNVAIIVVIAALLASLFPAMKAIKINPVEVDQE